MRLSYEPVTPAPAAGIIVLSVDRTVEADLRALVPAAALSLCHTRIESAPDVSAASLAAMADRLPAAAALLPGGLQAVGYACTSGALMIGEARVRQLIADAHPDAATTNPLSALKAACAGLGVRRLGLLSPYVAEVSAGMRAHLAECGIPVTAFASFEEENEARVASIAPRSVAAGLRRLAAQGDCDALFASCTGLRAVEAIGAVERELGLPVMASNQVLAWHLLRLCGQPWPHADALARAG
ncbi:MAG: Asp/Glu racemase [Rhodovibrio sp.]|nr:Asp/Glu racemase [Rhodovibrio sp.]